LPKNRALTLKKAHLRREKIKSALLDSSDYLYIKDIADLCAMKTIDISNDLKEMARLGLLSKKEDKTTHPKKLMYKIKPSAASRLSKEINSEVEKVKPTTKPTAKKAIPAPANASTTKVSKPTKVTKATKPVAPIAQKPVSKAVSTSKTKATANSKPLKVEKTVSTKATKPAAKPVGRPATKASAKTSPASEPKAKAATKAATKAAPKVVAAKAKLEKPKAAEKKPVQAKEKAPKIPKTAKVLAPKSPPTVETAPTPRRRARSGATQNQILTELEKGQALSIEELCQRLTKQPANMYKMVGTLLTQGQIQKQKSAGRAYVYSLSSTMPAPQTAAINKVNAKNSHQNNGTSVDAQVLDQFIDKLAGAAKQFLHNLLKNN
jgi:predicted transcriptional regulator